MILYKYMSWPLDGENHARELIESDEIYLSRPTEFNDPYDIGVVARRFCPCLAQDICQKLLPCFAA